MGRLGLPGQGPDVYDPCPVLIRLWSVALPRALGTKFLQQAILVMVALAVPLATIPRLPACECAPQGIVAAEECLCCQPKDTLVSSCCQSETSDSCCSKEDGEDCDCPKCRGEVLPGLELLAKWDRLSADSLSDAHVSAILADASQDLWKACRASEAPPPAIYLARHGPQLERLCRWLI